jgi:hypothetical protein
LIINIRRRIYFSGGVNIERGVCVCDAFDSRSINRRDVIGNSRNINFGDNKRAQKQQ